MWRVTYTDGSVSDRMSLFDQNLADIVKIERLPEPEPVKAVLFVPVGKMHGKGLFFRNGPFMDASREERRISSETERYRRVEVDLRKAIIDAITGYNERCRMNPRLCAKTLADEIAREIEGGA